MKLWKKVVPVALLITVVATCFAPLVQAQDSQDDNVVYLADMKPISINGNVPRENWRETWKGWDAHLGGKTMTNSTFIPPRILPYQPTAAVLFLGGDFEYFDAFIGVSDFCPDAKQMTRFQVLGDNKVLFTSEQMRSGDKPIHIHILVKEIVRLTLQTDGFDGIGGNHPYPNPQ